MMVIGLMMKNMEKEQRSGTLERYHMLVILKMDKKQVKEFLISAEINMKEILLMENFKDKENISMQ
jgi:hypothetical protein